MRAIHTFAALSMMALGILATATGPRPAAAQQFTGDASPTQISGYRNVLGRMEGQAGFGLYGIAWDETQNKPCRLWLLTRSLTDGTDRRVADSVLNMCGRESFLLMGSIPIPLGLGGNRRADFATNPRYFVRGIQVCANSGNNRMKGIRIFPGRVRPNGGPIGTNGQRVEAKQPNCGNNEWRSPVFCPQGQIAFGLLLHTENGSVTGLGLRCREVTW